VALSHRTHLGFTPNKTVSLVSIAVVGRVLKPERRETMSETRGSDPGTDKGKDGRGADPGTDTVKQGRGADPGTDKVKQGRGADPGTDKDKQGRGSDTGSGGGKTGMAVVDEE
jgi:hypothetical protein